MLSSTEKRSVIGNADSNYGDSRMKMTDVQIARLQPGAETDAIISRALFNIADSRLHYTTDISAAWEVRKRMEQLGWDSEDHQTGEDGRSVSYLFRFLRWQDGSGTYLSQPVTVHAKVEDVCQAPFAICVAALKAKSVMQD